MSKIDQYSDEEIMQIASTMPGGSTPNITMAPNINRIEPAGGDITFSGASGIDSRSGIVSKGEADNQVAVDKQKALMAGEVQQAALKKEADLIATRNIARKDLNTSLNSFLAIDEAIPRGEGFHRFGNGINTMAQKFGQDTELGRFAAVHEASGLALRTVLARMRDVGNLSENEQKAAEQMIPKIFDDEKVVELKRAFLKQMGMAVDSESKNLVVELVKKFKSSEAFDEDEHNQMNKTDLDGIFGPEEDVMKAKF